LVGKSGWYLDDQHNTAVRVIGKKIGVLRQDKGPVWVSVGMAACTVYSCCASSNAPLQDFERFLGGLKASIVRCAGRVLVAGEFNAKAYTWGSRVKDKRGTALADLIVELGMVIMNQGDAPTFLRGTNSSVIDVIFVSASLGICRWIVSDSECGSDHLPISFVLKEATS
jgi:endonuclease/exonuclease/phosphatase (EEP) superfamily protein YafD